MTKASVLPLPVTCQDGENLVCFSSQFLLEGKQEDKLPFHEVLTASAATSLFFMNRGMVADWRKRCKAPVRECQAPRRWPKALGTWWVAWVTKDPTTMQTLSRVTTRHPRGVGLEEHSSGVYTDVWRGQQAELGFGSPEYEPCLASFSSLWTRKGLKTLSFRVPSGSHIKKQ